MHSGATSRGAKCWTGFSKVVVLVFSGCVLFTGTADGTRAHGSAYTCVNFLFGTHRLCCFVDMALCLHLLAFACTGMWWAWGWWCVCACACVRVKTSGNIDIHKKQTKRQNKTKHKPRKARRLLNTYSAICICIGAYAHPRVCIYVHTHIRAVNETRARNVQAHGAVPASSLRAGGLSLGWGCRILFWCVV